MGPGILRPRAGGRRSVRGEGARQRARVHGAPAAGALPALCARGPRRRRRRAGGLATHRGEPLGGDGRARPAGAHAAGPARRGRARVPPAAAAGGLRRARWLADRLEGAARRRGAARPGGRGRAPCARPRPGPDRGLRGQADRLEGGRPAAGGLAARGGARCPTRGSASWASAPTATRSARCVEALAAADLDGAARDRGARAGARGRPGGRARLPDRVPRLPRRATRRDAYLARRARPRRRGCTSPAASSTTTCPAPARLRGAGRAEHVPRGVRHGGRRGGRLRGAAALGRALRAWRRSPPRWPSALEPPLRPLLSFERGPGAVEEIAEQAGRAGSRCRPPTERARAPPRWPIWRGATYGWESVAEGVIAAARAARGAAASGVAVGVPASQ